MPDEFVGQCQVIQTVEEAVRSGQELPRNGANVTNHATLLAAGGDSGDLGWALPPLPCH